MLIKLLVDGLVLRVASAVIYGTIFYWVVGLRASASAFTLFLGVLASFSALVSASSLIKVKYISWAIAQGGLDSKVHDESNSSFFYRFSFSSSRFRCAYLRSELWCWP